MIATYSAKKRHYRYYICQTAREKGWKFCATKSVSADLLEGSIVIQLRSQFSDAATRQVFQVSESDWQDLVLADAEVIPRIIQARIEQIHYDGPKAGGGGVEGVEGADKDQALRHRAGDPGAVPEVAQAGVGLAGDYAGDLGVADALDLAE